MACRKLEDWQWAWGAWFSGVVVMAATVAILSIGNLPMVIWFSVLAGFGIVGAYVAFTPIQSKKEPENVRRQPVSEDTD